MHAISSEGAAEHQAAGVPPPPEGDGDGDGGGGGDGGDDVNGDGDDDGAGGRDGEPPPPHADATHVPRSSHTLLTAVVRAAHVVALPTADVLIEGQYVVKDAKLVAYEPAMAAHIESPYELNVLIVLVHVDSSVGA